MPYFKRKTQKSNPQKSVGANLDSLLPVEKIIRLAQSRGVDLGPGDPNEWIRYCIKLGLLPQATDKTHEKIGNSSATTADFLPLSAVNILLAVDKLKKQGLSLPQIAEALTKKKPVTTEASRNPKPPEPKPIELENFVPPYEANGNLVPTNRVIEEAQNLGVDFGPGNPNERIRYFIKLGILPHAVRKIRAEDPFRLGKIEGHLPEWTIKRLLYIHKLYQNGLSFPQIAEKIREKDSKVETPDNPTTRQPDNQSSKAKASLPKGFYFFPRIGLTEKDLERKLARHEQKIKQTVQDEIVANSAYTGASPVPPVASSTLRTLTIIVTLTAITSGLVFAGVKIAGDRHKSGQLEQETAANLNKLGEVLAASSDRHRFYIDADTEVSGLTTFLEDITAPNVVYSVTGGTGISVTGGQNPVIGLDSTEIVTSLNDAAGAVTLKAGTNTTVSTSGSTITISASGTSEADTLATVTGRGATTSTATTFSGGLTLGGNISFSDTNSVFNITNAGTLAIKDGTNTLLTVADQGSYGTVRLSDKGSTGDPATCSAGDIYFNATDTTVKACTAANSWESLDGAGGITTFTLSADSGSDQTISDTDILEIAGGTNGIDTAAGATDTVTLNFDSTEVGSTTWGTATGTIWTFESGTTDPTFTFASDQITIGGAATLTATAVTDFDCTNCIDFDDIADSPTLDATTDINLSTLDLYVDLTSTGVFSLRDGTTAFWTFDDDSTVDVVFPAAGTITFDGVITNNTTTTGVIDLNVTSTTTNNRGLDISYAFGGGAATTGYGIYGSTSQSGTAANTVYGQYATLADPMAFGNTNFGFAFYGNVTGDVNATKTSYGIYSDLLSDNTTTSQGTRNAYAGYFSARGSTRGANTATAIYATASGGDFNYAGIFDGYVGIGDTSPTSKLDILNTTSGVTATTITSNVSTTNADNFALDVYNTSTSTSDATSKWGARFTLSGTWTGGQDTAESDTLGVQVIHSTVSSWENYSFYTTGITGGGRNNYGIYLGAVSGASVGNYSIYSAGGSVNIQGLTASQLVLTDSNKNLVSATATAANTCSDCLIQVPLTTGRNTVTPTANSVVALTLNGTSGTATTALNIAQGGDANAQTIASNATTSGTVLDISATALTSGKGITFTGPSGGTAGITGSAISLTSDLGNAGELLNIAGTIDTTTDAHSATGISNVILHSSVLATTVSQTHYGIFNTLTKTGADTTSGTIALYGTYSTASNTGGDTAGTRNTYGGYFKATGDSSGTTTTYGIYSASTGSADTNYAGFFDGDVNVSGGTLNTQVALKTNTATRVDALGFGDFRNLTVREEGLTTMPTATSSNMVQGTYIGNGQDNRNITGVGFTADLIMIVPESGNGAWRTSAMSGDNSIGLFSGALVSNVIQGTSSDGFQVGTSLVNTAGTVYHWVAFKDNGNDMAVGTYTSQTPLAAEVVTGLGFQPELVWVAYGASGSINNIFDRNCWTTSTVTAGNVFKTGIAALAANRITSLDADGFTAAATDDTCANDNDADATFYWFAFDEAAGKTADGTYTGNNTDNTNITGLNFSPDIVLVKRLTTTENDFWHPRTLRGDSTIYAATAASATADQIQGFQSDGFQVGNDGTINVSAETYHYFAWKEQPVGGVLAGTFNVDVDTLADSRAAAQISATSVSTTGNTSYGLYNQWSSSAVVTGTAQTAFGAYNLASKIGADTSSAATALYGTYSVATNTGSTNAGTKNTYGGFFSAAGDLFGTTNAYGVYTTASGADTNYGIYSAAGTGVFKLGAGEQVYIDGTSTANTGTAGILDIDVSSATNQNTGINLNYTYNPSASAATGYGLYEAMTVNTAGANKFAYGQYLTITNSSTTATNNVYGTYNLITDSSTAGNSQLYGAVVSVDMSANTATGTPRVYGGYFSATGQSAGANTLAYGIYASASGADTNYAIYGIASPGGATNYALYTEVGNIYHKLNSLDSVVIDGSTTPNGASAGALDINVSSSSNGDTGVNLNYTFNTSFASGKGYGIYQSTTVNTSGTSNIAYGQYHTLTNDATGNANTVYGSYTNITDADTLANTLYGIVSNVDQSTNSSAGSMSIFGAHFTAVGQSTGNTNSYGVYASATLADNNYGLFVNTMTAANLINTGLEIGAMGGAQVVRGINIGTVSSAAASSSTYGINIGNISGGTFLNYGINIGTTTGGTGSSVYTINTGALTAVASGTNAQLNLGTISGTAASSNNYGIRVGAMTSTGTANYGIYVGSVSGATNNYSLYTAAGNVYNLLGAAESVSIIGTSTTTTAGVLDINVTTSTSANTGINLSYTTSAANQSYGIYETMSVSGSSASATRYGLFQTLSVDVTTNATTAYGQYTNITDADSLANTLFGIVSNVDNSGNNSAGTPSIYGSYFTAVGQSGGTNTNAYGVVASASGSDFNYGIYVNGISTASVNRYGLTIGALSGSSSVSTGITIGAISGASATGTGISIGNISTTGAASTAISLGTLTGGTSTNYQIDSGNITAVASATNAHINLGTISGTAASSNNYGIRIGAMTSTGTANYGIYVGAVSGATNNYGLFTAGGIVQFTCTTSATTWTTSQANPSCSDYAETYETNDNNLERGDIVAIETQSGNKVTRSTSGYQQEIIGIYSTSPGMLIGPDGIESAGGENSVDNLPQGKIPVALTGKVPTKISTENGPISAGDMITSSSIAGVGMKATKVGRTVGVALESFEPTSDQQQGTIIVFVEPGWYLGSALANGSIEQAPSTQLSNDPTIQLSDLPIDELGRLIREGRLDGQILTAEQIMALVDQRVDEKLAGLQAESTQATSSALADSQEASSSAQLAQVNNQTLDELNKLLATTNLSLDTLSVIGQTRLAQTQVAGTFSQDGTLIIDYGRQINVLGSTLFLQNDGLAGGCAQGETLGSTQGLSLCNVLVDIGAGSAIFDKDGNLKILGTLTAKSLEAEEIAISIKDAGSSSVGSTSIEPGSIRLTIATTAIKPGARVLITPTGPTGGKVIYISAKTDFEGFTVALENGPAQNRIDFDWLIVNSKQVSQAN